MDASREPSGKAHPAEWGGSAGVLLLLECSGKDGKGLGCNDLICLVAHDVVSSFLCDVSHRYGRMWSSLSRPQQPHQTGNLVYGLIWWMD